MNARAPFLLPLLALPLAASEVHVVDANGGPGSDFLEIADAVAAAASGDTLLVRGGGYAPFEIAGKSLTVVEDSGQDARVAGTVGVRDLLPGQTVVLRGLRTSGVIDGPGLSIRDCAGPVWVEDCRWFAEGASDSPGVEVEGSSRVVLAQVVSFGAPAPPSGGLGFGTPGGNGLSATDAALAVWFGAYTGRPGIGGDEWGGAGGSGLWLNGSSAWVSGVRLVGADGGWADSDIDIFGSGDLICNPPGPGGSGIWIFDFSGSGTGVVRTLDNHYLFGAGGFNQEPGCPSGPNGMPVSVSPSGGEWVDLPGEARSFRASSPVRAGETVELDFEGPAGELAAAFFSVSPLELYLDAAVGVLHTAPPLVPLALGALPESGELTARVVAPGPPPALDALTLFGQGVFLDPRGSARLGSPSVLTLLEGAL